MERVKSAPGTLVVSLDFELQWGVYDHPRPDLYAPHLRGERIAVPALLEAFAKFDIHATWATVGFLFFDGRDSLLRHLPSLQPTYKNSKLNPYLGLNKLGASEKEDELHFAPSLIRLIRNYAGQEIATHTFSHYYCLEEGQTVENFRSDLETALRVAKQEFEIEVTSLVFPRNQFNRKYLQVCRELGIRAFRGNQNSFLYRAAETNKQGVTRRLLRLIDAYCPVSGPHLHHLTSEEGVYNLPASRLLRPWNSRFKYLEKLRLKRIKKELTMAAQQNKIYHLWWHPHNFGVDLEKNLEFLSEILEHYDDLKERYGMQSKNMGEMAAGLPA